MREFITGLFGYRFDFEEFLAGLIAGIILAWVLVRMRPIFTWILGLLQSQTRRLGERLAASSINRYQVELITRAQTMHVSNPIFALDEVVIPPRLLAPPIPADPQSDELPPEDTLSVVPNLPDWTFLSGLYSAPTISLANALSNGANLMITGPLGSGKTTALAYFAIRCANRDPEAGIAVELTPVLINAADLQLDKKYDKDPLKPLISAVQQTVSPGLASRIPGYLRPQFRQGRALLLLDGLDLMTLKEVTPVAEWLTLLLEEFPDNRVIAAGPVSGYDGMVKAGLNPIPIAPWSDYYQREFLTRWAQSWQQYVIPNLPKKRIGDLDPALITGWLIGLIRGLTPLELTLQTWAAYAGDTRGARVVDNMESYIRRILSTNELQPAEAAALSWINERQGAVPERIFRRGTPIDSLIEAGILAQRLGKKASFTQPAIGAYLAARAMVETGVAESTTQTGWAPAEDAMGFLAAMGDITEIANRYLESDGDPLEAGLLSCAHWLREAPLKTPWKDQALRALATIASSQIKPYGLRLRTVHALAQTKDPSVGILFRRLLSSDTPSSRVLGALGLGGLEDEDTIDTLLDIVYQDRNLHVRQAACLALAAIGTETALEGLGKVLLEGDEAVRLAAAEALAAHPDEGFNMLRDASEHDNLLTRRAAVFGLARVPEKWSLEILERMQVEDDQWVVRGAAAEAAERRRDPPWKVPPITKEVAELPWLIEFAANEGLGVAPGSAAMEMVRRALNKGTEDEKIAALEAIALAGDEELGLELYQALQGSEPFLRDAAYEALWRLRATGVELPSPEQYGLS
jgi:HEAT repeat protein